MQNLTITPQNLGSVDWSEDCFKYCDFLGIAPDGAHVTADFTNCTFRDTDWYWGLFNLVNFTSCKFINCTFRGSSFPECRFVDCEFEGCRFIRDNLDGECAFEGAVAYGCKLSNSEGFKAEPR